MKRSLSIILAVVLLLSLAPLAAFGANAITVTLDDKAIEFPDAAPFVDANSRTLTPLSPIANAMGLTVTWDGAKKVATFTREYTAETAFMLNTPDETHTGTYFVGRETLAFTIGSKEAIYNAYYFDTTDKEKTTILEDQTYTKTISMDTAAIIKDQRTYAPVKYLAETLGYSVNWVGETSTVQLAQNPNGYQIFTFSLLGNSENQIALGLYKGDIFDMADMISVKFDSVKVNGKTATVEKFNDDALTTLKEESSDFEDFLDGCYIKAPFEEDKENTLVINVTCTYTGNFTATHEITLTYTPEGYGGIL